MRTGSRVFVADGRSIAALTVLRSLGARGLRLTAGESYRYNYSFYSRHARQKVVYSDPGRAPDGFVRDLLREISSAGYDTIIPCADDSGLQISRHRTEFEKHLRLCISDYDTLMVGRDKGRTVRAALKAGVPIPLTFFPEEMPIREIAARTPYPALVRPRISSGARGIAFVRDSVSLLDAYERVRRAHGEPLVQEYLDHTREHYSACFLFNRQSELRASFVYRELRQYPINGGPATFATSVKHPAIVSHGARLLQNLGWQGVAHMDFLVDPRDGTPRLLEINPRFWMSLPLAVFAGVDFPWLLYRLATEPDIEPVLDYQEGLSYRWLLPADLLWFWKVKDKRRHLKDFLRFRGDDLCYAVISRKDPLPVLGFVLQTLYFLADKSRRDHIVNRGW